MTAVSIILGILMVICGVSCMFTPIATAASAGYFIIALLLVYGIVGIVKAISDKEYGVNFLFAILSAILGVVVLCVPDLALLVDGVLLYMIASWFVLQGLVTIFLALNAKRITKGKLWILGLVIGIIGILVGIFSFIHPLVLLVAIGVLIGVYFIEVGVSLIVAATQNMF